MSFINQFFLFGLAAMALPVLFHFVKKMKARTIPFSSLMFLTATPKELVKKRRLRDLLLMTVRAFIIGLLALAFSRPFLQPDLVPFISTDENESVVLLLDASYSMQAAGAFDSAKQGLLERIDNADRRDELAVVVFSDTPEQLTELGSDPELSRSVISAMTTTTSRGTDYFEPLQLAQDILKEARHKNRRVILASDYQLSGWTGSLDNWKLDDGIQFESIQIEPAVDNRFVEDFELRSRRTGDNVAVQLNARITATTGDSESGVSASKATLSSDGRVIEERDLDALETNRLSFQWVTDRLGTFQRTLALASDGLAIDNVAYITYAVDSKPSVLIIDTARRGTRRDAFFLEKAFDIGADAPFDFEQGGRNRLAFDRMRQASIVFVANLPTLSADEVAAIKRYAESGGHVVISFGNRTQLASYASALETLGIGNVDGVVNPRTLQGSNAIIGEVDWKHPVFAPLGSTGTGAILRPEFRRYMKLVADSAATVVGTFDTGDPFFVERRLGLGSVITYASTLNNAWTNFPIDELYIPFVYQIARYASESDNARRQYFVGESVQLSGRAGDTWDVRKPNGDIAKVDVLSDGTGLFRQTDEPGHYLAARGSTQFPFSVNVDTEESILTYRDEEEAYASLITPASADSDVNAAGIASPDDERSQMFWRIPLIALIVLFMLETYLANRSKQTGRSGQGTPTTQRAKSRQVS